MSISLASHEVDNDDGDERLFLQCDVHVTEAGQLGVQTKVMFDDDMGSDPVEARDHDWTSLESHAVFALQDGRPILIVAFGYEEETLQVDLSNGRVIQNAGTDPVYGSGHSNLGEFSDAKLQEFLAVTAGEVKHYGASERLVRRLHNLVHEFAQRLPIEEVTE